MLIVQSELAPNWQLLLDRQPDYVALPLGTDLTPLDTKERQLAFTAGQILSFRLRANPTKKLKAEGRKNGIRVGLTTEKEQLAWLQRKADTGGFRLRSAVVIPEEFSPEPRRSRQAKKAHDEDTSPGAEMGIATAVQVARKLTHLAAHFEGVLQIVDPTVFQQTLRCGIGSAKGFGFGLLSLARG